MKDVLDHTPAPAQCLLSGARRRPAARLSPFCARSTRLNIRGCSDLTLYVIDVAAGDKIPRKGGRY
jgi:hypothetical protein